MNNSEETRGLLGGVPKKQKKSNPYPHLKSWEVRKIREFCHQQKIEVESFLAELERNRANPRIITVTSEDGRSLNFAKITMAFGAVGNKSKCQILILSNGKIMGGYGSGSMPTLPRFMAGTVKKRYFPSGYIETTSFGVAPEDTIDEVKKFNPISRWAFDILTKYISDFDDRPEECWQLGTFFEDMIVKHLWLRCKELIQVDPLLGPLFTGEEYQRNDEAIRALEDYIGSIDLLHIPPPEEWETSLKDILISQMAGDVLEERDRDKEFIDKLLGKSH